MANVDVKEIIEQISENLVLMEPSDLQSLSTLHTLFGNISQWADENSQTFVVTVVKAVEELIEEIIMKEVTDAVKAIDTIGHAVMGLQAILRDGRNVNEVAFPAELNVVQLNGNPGTGNATANIVLPPHVDEAIFADFLARQGGVLDEIENLVLSLEKTDDENDFASLRRIIHTLKGESALLGLGDVELLCHKIEDVYEEKPVSEIVDPLLTAKDWLSRTFDSYSGKGEVTESVDTIIEILMQSLPSVKEETTADITQIKKEAVAQEDEGKKYTDLPTEPHPLTGDLELAGDFVVEAREHLDMADVHLLTLETDPANSEAINAVFRGFHTIKGVAGFLALEEILALAHEAETLLDRARKGELSLQGSIIDITFDSLDFLKRLVSNVADALESGELLSVELELPNLLHRIAAASQGKEFEKDPPVEPRPGEKLGDILIENGDATEVDIENALVTQEEAPEHRLIGDIIVRYCQISRAHIDEALEKQKNNPEKKLGEILVDLGAITQKDLDNAIKLQDESGEIPKLGEILCASGNINAKDIARALRSQNSDRRNTDRRETDRRQTERREVVKVKESVKVDAGRLDQLVDAIGELVIAESMVTQSPELQATASAELLRHINLLDKITRELQEMGTSLRMVPVRATFQKMARLVRDLAKKSGKKVDFIMAGEDTELDKSVVDRIGDPLVHMVRNAVDHGIEDSPEDRVKAGKPEVAKVELRAFHKGGSIFVEVEEDGRGLDRDVIMAKAIERKLVTDPNALSDREIWNLIFEPGFSTAKTVTDVSGRGVGMDVVRKNIEALRGQVEIRTEKGKGSAFSIRLPLTLAIIDGMVISVGSERYIIPTLSIVMSIRPEAKDLSTVVGKGEMLSLQGKLIPLFRLGDMFNVEDCKKTTSEAIVMIVEDEGSHVGLLLDEILGQQQIVIKSLGESMRGTPGITGGAIMPDGNVGLILDISGLVKLAHSE